jgi:hypothetical protein
VAAAAFAGFHHYHTCAAALGPNPAGSVRPLPPATASLPSSATSSLLPASTVGSTSLLRCLPAVLMRLSAARQTMGGTVEVEALLSVPDCRSTGETPGKFSALSNPRVRHHPVYLFSGFLSLLLSADWLGSLSLILSNLFSAFVDRLITQGKCDCTTRLFLSDSTLLLLDCQVDNAMVLQFMN